MKTKLPPHAVIDREIKTPDVLQFLRDKYESKYAAPEWVYFEELKMGLGYEGNDAVQRLDFFAFACWKQEKYRRITYEIKVSRADFLKEKKNPLKKRVGLIVSNHFYFIAPRGIIKPEEVPIECGLIELYWTNNQAEIDKHEEYAAQTGYATYWYRTHPAPKFREYLTQEVVVEAPWRDTPPPSWKFVGNLCRRIFKQEQEDGKRSAAEDSAESVDALQGADGSVS